MGKFLLVVIVFAVIVYLTVRIIQRRGIMPQRRPMTRPVAPDDDPDFLRDLDRKRWRRKPQEPEDPETPA